MSTSETLNQTISMLTQPSRQPSLAGPRTIAITSGKGGVGKTLTTVNMALAARRLGLEVLILDGDLGLANVDVVLGLQTRYSIADVLEGQVELSDIVLTGPMGLKVIPSGSGITKLTALTNLERMQIVDQIEQLNFPVDLVMIDTGAGISDNVLYLNAIADETIVVTTPEPHAMTDAYAMIKVMSESHGIKRISLLVNQSRSSQQAVKVYERIAEVSARFLNTTVDYLGHVPDDPQVCKAVALRRAASEQSMHTIAGQAWSRIIENVLHKKTGSANGNIDKLWQNLLWTNGSQEMHLVR